MEVIEELKFEGTNFFRQYLTYSLLSGRSICISQIRFLDNNPGIKGFKIFCFFYHLFLEHEVKLIAMFEKLSNGTNVVINKTGFILFFLKNKIF